MRSKKEIDQNVKGLMALSRWKEYITFVIPLTLLGGILGVVESESFLDTKIIFVLLGNLLAVGYAFMINDIEDAVDDARDAGKAKRNPIVAGKISKKTAMTACRILAILTIMCFSLVNTWVLWIGTATLLLSHFYSWKPVRLKAWPVVDIVSHSLMLSGLLILSGYYAYESSPGVVWYVIAGATLFSVYGQLYNQLRDFEVDKKAKLRNTAILIGMKQAKNIMYLAVALALACFGIAAFKGVFPLWIGGILLGSILLTRKIKTKHDFSGTAVIDISGSMQLQGTIIMNAVVLTWLAVILYQQLF